MKTLISFRLRKVLDADLIAAGVSEDNLPDLCRDGLRLMLGLSTTRQIEVTEKPIAAVAIKRTETQSTTGKQGVNTPSTDERQPHLIRSTSAVYRPAQQQR